jgi:hypothetical protein
MAERGIELDHSTIRRWAIYFSPRLLERFNRRKRTVTRCTFTAPLTATGIPSSSTSAKIVI